MKNNQPSPFVRVLIDSAYYSVKEEFPPKNREVLEFAVSVIQGITGYGEIKVIRRWLKTGDIEGQHKRGLSKSNFVRLMKAWAGKVPAFQTVADIRHFAAYGRDVFVKWVYSPDFTAFSLKKKLPKDPLSPYWRSVKLTYPVIWNSLDLEEALLDNLRILETESIEKLSNYLKKIAIDEQNRAANAFWQLDFSLDAIPIAINLVESDLISWDGLSEELSLMEPPVHDSDEKTGGRKLLRFIFSKLSDTSQEFFALLGGIPFLRYYTSLSIQALWQLDDLSSVERELENLASWGLLNSQGKYRWRIQEFIWEIAHHRFSDLPASKQNMAKGWEKRYLNVMKKEHRLPDTPIRYLLKRKKSNQERQDAGILQYRDEPFGSRFMELFLSGKCPDTEANYFEDNSPYIDSDQYIYTRFLCKQWVVVLKQALIISFLSIFPMTLLIVMTINLPYYSSIIFPAIVLLFSAFPIGWAVWRIIQLDRAWINFWKDVIPQLPESLKMNDGAKL